MIQIVSAMVVLLAWQVHVPLFKIRRPAATITCTTTTANASLATVQTAVDNATTGDTICVPAGTVTWSGTLVITKNVSIIGAGAGSTVLANARFDWGVDGGACPQSSARVSAMTINWNADSLAFALYCAQGWRIDHMTVTYPVASDMMNLWGYAGVGTGEVSGLFDHNDITYGRSIYRGEVSSGKGSARWAEDLNLGTSHFVYYEDNVIRWTSGDGGNGAYLNAFDGNQGCRYILRFNTIYNTRGEWHSLQDDNDRGCRAFEIYNNTWISNGIVPQYRIWFVRGGTGVIFHESADGHATDNRILIDNDRSHEGSIANTTQVPGATGTQNQVPTFGMCGWNGTEQANGNSFIDGNVTGQRGWPCRDQIGRSTDASLWSSSFTNPAPAQSSQPAYIWRNTNPSGEVTVGLNCENNGIPCSHQSTYHIVESRDYYTYRSSFNGTVGVGEGTLASRPATCTTGVAYWVTDRGSWRTALAANASGRLDVCTATDTWTDGYYTPYTYPHPLQSF